MDVNKAITTRRSIRRFKQDPISREVLKKIMETARIAPSSGNVQPLQYIVVTNPALVEQVFACTKWAGHIAPAGDPPEGERPVAYIIVLVDTEVMSNPQHAQRDSGAAVENMMLTAVEEGIGSCWLGTLDKKKLREILNIPEQFVIDTVVALGRPNEDPVIVEARDSIKYYKDENGRLYVPKRKFKDIVEFRD